MNNYLIEQFKSLGSNEPTAVLAAQVYLDLCEVKLYWSPSYSYNSQLQKIIIRAKQKSSSDVDSIFVPISSYEPLSFTQLQNFLLSCTCSSDSPSRFHVCLL
ncbi:uncharacterized protein [Euwallacea similis]|uniref:uncharacterized protein n=1 Tax=Euwallacea similis TaxID=1736056 RepID=UPI00344CE68C